MSKIKRKNELGEMYMSPNKKRKVGLPAPRWIPAVGNQPGYWSIWPYKTAVAKSHGGSSGHGITRKKGKHDKQRAIPALHRKQHLRTTGAIGTANGLHDERNKESCHCGRCSTR